MTPEIDIEKACASPSSALSEPVPSLFARCLQRIRGWQNSKAAPGANIKQIEDYPNGYPRFSALLAAHDQFLVVRRFSGLRARLLLLAQDRLVELEERLCKVDHKEEAKVFLASRRLDTNQEREAILSEIQETLCAYDSLVERTARVSQLHAPHPWHVQSLRNWLDGSAAIAHRESDFLEHEADLASLGRDEDNMALWLETMLSRLPRRLQKILYLPSNISRDSNVHITPRTVSDQIVRIIIAPVVAVILLIPVVICHIVTDSNKRLFTIILSSYMFVLLLSLWTRSNTTTLTMAGATYTAVLIVFISN